VEDNKSNEEDSDDTEADEDDTGDKDAESGPDSSTGNLKRCQWNWWWTCSIWLKTSVINASWADKVGIEDEWQKFHMMGLC
jgi:hypothetical protein